MVRDLREKLRAIVLIQKEAEHVVLASGDRGEQVRKRLTSWRCKSPGGPGCLSGRVGQSEVQQKKAGPRPRRNMDDQVDVARKQKRFVAAETGAFTVAHTADMPPRSFARGGLGAIAEVGADAPGARCLGRAGARHQLVNDLEPRFAPTNDSILHAQY
jgi:hypothetical protein